jgi:hypothetical protein
MAVAASRENEQAAKLAAQRLAAHAAALGLAAHA